MVTDRLYSQMAFTFPLRGQTLALVVFRQITADSLFTGERLLSSLMRC